jgi:competence protein ComEC
LLLLFITSASTPGLAQTSTDAVVRVVDIGPGLGPLASGPRNNALSIVIRFKYGGHSVLLTGDPVGRMIGDPPATCEYAERIMVGNQSRVPIDSDVLIGQHHGADNSASSCFVSAVSPEFVVFSAGHHFRHPTQAAVDRLTSSGRVSLANIFRTDRGDNEGGSEMTAGAGTCPDKRGDDDVEIRLPRSSSGRVTVAYRAPDPGCGS